MPSNGGGLDPGARAILAEIRDLRIEMREDRRRSDEERRQADARFERMFKQMHTVGRAILRVLERIDRNTGGRNNGRPRPNGGRG